MQSKVDSILFSVGLILFSILVLIMRKNIGKEKDYKPAIWAHSKEQRRNVTLMLGVWGIITGLILLIDALSR